MSMSTLYTQFHEGGGVREGEKIVVDFSVNRGGGVGVLNPLSATK